MLTPSYSKWERARGGLSRPPVGPARAAWLRRSPVRPHRVGAAFADVGWKRYLAVPRLQVRATAHVRACACVCALCACVRVCACVHACLPACALAMIASAWLCVRACARASAVRAFASRACAHACGRACGRARACTCVRGSIRRVTMRLFDRRSACAAERCLPPGDCPSGMVGAPARRSRTPASQTKQPVRAWMGRAAARAASRDARARGLGISGPE